MNNVGTGVLCAVGSAIGFVVGYFVAQNKWQKIADEEIESVKQAFKTAKDAQEEDTETISDPEEYDELAAKYATPPQENISKPEPKATDSEDDEEWCVYTQEEFEELEVVPNVNTMGYGTLYSDDTWCMDDDEPMILAQKIETFGSAEMVNRIRDILIKDGGCFVKTPYGWYEMMYDTHPYDDDDTHPRPQKVVIEDEET